MSPSWEILLPHAILGISACLMLAGRRLAGNRPVWGPLCLVVIALAAHALAWSGHVFPLTAPTSQPTTIATNLGPTSESTDVPTDPRGLSRSSVTADSLSMFLQWLTLGLGFLWTLTALAGGHPPGTAALYFGLVLCVLASLMLIISADELVLLYLALELLAWSSCFQIFLPPQSRTTVEAGSKFFLMSLLASALLLVAFAMLYGLAGTTQLTEIRHVLQAATEMGPDHTVARELPLVIAALAFLLAGLGLKLAIVPFHAFALDLAEGLPAWNMGLVTVFHKIAGFAVLTRIVVMSLTDWSDTAQLMVLVLAIATMTAGNALAVTQTKLRRTLVALGIAHTGYLLVGIATALGEDQLAPAARAIVDFPPGLAATLFALLTYSLAFLGLTSLIAHLSPAGKTIEYLAELKGLWHSQPLPHALAALLILSLAGIPPLAGFWGQWLLLGAALNVRMESQATQLLTSHPMFVVLAIITVFNALVTAGVYLKMLMVMTLDAPLARPQPAGGQASLAAAMISGLLLLGLGLLPGPLLGLLDAFRP